MTPHSPTMNGSAARAYGVKSLDQKAQSKTALQEELGWAQEPKRPVICLPLGVNDALGGKILQELMPGLLTLPVEILILGKGSSNYGNFCTELTQKHGHRIAIIPNKEDAIRKMYAAADMALFLSDPLVHKELGVLLRCGTIPVAPACKGLSNYDPNQESGNAFLYDNLSVWGAYGAIVRALETYRFPFDWKTIQRHGMELVEKN